ncbi:unnamed protein product, partial [Rotaria sordida]
WDISHDGLLDVNELAQLISAMYDRTGEKDRQGDKNPTHRAKEIIKKLDAFDERKINVLNTVRCAEFVITSCNISRNKSIHIGKQLVPFLNTCMPHLQTLRLRRPDDFPWTTKLH